MDSALKIMIVTLPLRAEPTQFPPFGSLTLINYLRKHGIDDVEFYDIDVHRPTFEEVMEHIRKAKPGILGISAVVSTAYAYTKRLSLAVKEALPDTLIVLGGNMGSSAEILLRKTGVDLVVVGEGEKTFLNICRLAEETRNPVDFGCVRGLMFVGGNGGLVNTGYEDQLAAEELYEIKWDDLEKSSGTDTFFIVVDDEPGYAEQFKNDPRFHEPHRRGKTIVCLYTSKGCVAKCTFCHRWDKGLRSIPVDLVIERMKETVERFNVGYFTPADENFGADPRWLEEFCAKMKELDLLWSVNTRAKGITREKVEMMKDAGCIRLIYGTETGSERMLQVMEKKVSLDQNYAANRLAAEAGIGGTVALVVGMPGETPDTIKETTEFCKKIIALTPKKNPNSMSINYAQALPGTPLYEYGRHKGLIGKDLDGEEQYLLDISDRNAHDEFSTLNFTDYPTLLCQTWRPLISIEVNYHFAKTHGIDHYRRILLNDKRFIGTEGTATGYYANPQRLLETGGGLEVDEFAKTLAFTAQASTGNTLNWLYRLWPGIPARNSESNPGAKLPSLFSLVRSGKFGLALVCYPIVAHHMRHFLVVLTWIKDVKKYGWSYSIKMLGEYLAYRIRALSGGKELPFTYRSLRKVVAELKSLSEDSLEMAPLRKGR